MICAPPTAVQLLALMQLIAKGWWRRRGPHVAPLRAPSVVVITCEPTAMHDVSLEHAMPLRPATPVGTDWGVHVVPPLVVLRIDADGPPDEEPTAVQSSESTQEIAVKLETVDGNDSNDHTVPPSVVTRILGEPDPASKSLTA